jgi:hypothetical protein
MGFRFTRRITLFPGVRANISKSGVSWTFGRRGASVNVGKRGVYRNLGIPGTGLSHRARLDTSASPDLQSAGGQETPATGWQLVGAVLLQVLGVIVAAVVAAGVALFAAILGAALSSGGKPKRRRW